MALLASAADAAMDISVGALLPGTAAVLTAVAAGVVWGLVGSVGPSSPGVGIMLSIGVFAQFGGSSLPCWRGGSFPCDGDSAG